MINYRVYFHAKELAEEFSNILFDTTEAVVERIQEGDCSSPFYVDVGADENSKEFYGYLASLGIVGDARYAGYNVLEGE